VLLDDAERKSFIADRLTEAFARPLTAPGSEVVAGAVLSLFGGVDLISSFAQKGLETLRDGQQHSLMVLSAHEPRVGVMFVAWNGTHVELQPMRFGSYLQPLLRSAFGLVEQGAALAGFLEIDAYLRDEPDPAEPDRGIDEVFAVDVEFAFLPGALLGCPAEQTRGLPPTLILNPDLCSPEEAQALERLKA
jgi:hypothetical protein